MKIPKIIFLVVVLSLIGCVIASYFLKPWDLDTNWFLIGLIGFALSASFVLSNVLKCLIGFKDMIDLAADKRTWDNSMKQF